MTPNRTPTLNWEYFLEKTAGPQITLASGLKYATRNFFRSRGKSF